MRGEASLMREAVTRAGVRRQTGGGALVRVVSG
jgi:hypothetical protein